MASLTLASFPINVPDPRLNYTANRDPATDPWRHALMVLMPPAFHLTRRRLIAAALVVLLIALIMSPAIQGRLDAAAAWTIGFAEMHPRLGAAIFVLFSAVSAMLAFFSSGVLVPPAILVWGRLGAFVLMWAGWTLGAVAAYGIGWAATPWLARLGYEKKLEKYQRGVSTHMRFWQVLVFCLAVPSEVPGYLFGSAHYSFAKFLIAIGIAEAVYAALLILAGQQLIAYRFSAVVLAGGVLAAVVVIGVIVSKKKRAKLPPPETLTT
jgi:uncharacterized membrane protein YdjX (TVP38/TMEM64 family)